jgi:hypothetical protein
MIIQFLVFLSGRLRGARKVLSKRPKVASEKPKDCSNHIFKYAYPLLFHISPMARHYTLHPGTVVVVLAAACWYRVSKRNLWAVSGTNLIVVSGVRLHGQFSSHCSWSLTREKMLFVFEEEPNRSVSPDLLCNGNCCYTLTLWDSFRAKYLGKRRQQLKVNIIIYCVLGPR